MFYKVIENYLSKLEKKDILMFGKKNNIELNESELNYIYNVIKNNYKDLLGYNYNTIFKEAENHIEFSKIKKIYNLYLDYRNKYFNLIN